MIMKVMIIKTAIISHVTIWISGVNFLWVVYSDHASI